MIAMTFQIPTKRGDLQYAIFRMWLFSVVLTTIVAACTGIYAYIFSDQVIPVEVLHLNGTKSEFFKKAVSNITQNVLTLFLPMGAIITPE